MATVVGPGFTAYPLDVTDEPSRWLDLARQFAFRGDGTTCWHASRPAGTIARMTDTRAPVHECTFCEIVEGRAEASVVYQDEVALVFMDLNPITPGHLLVVPRVHAVGLEDLDETTGAHVWSVAHRMARALRRSGLRCEGINVFLADGQAAFQDVFHFHLHVFPRYPGDEFTIDHDGKERRPRDLLNREAQAVKQALGTTLS